MTDDSQVPTAPGIGLLVSVRSAEEAARALAGGASLIDVKEPLHGSLGRADDTVIEAVLRTVGDVRPVSAALGEWAETSSAIPPLALTFVKWGLAGCQHRNDWRQRLVPLMKTQRQPQVVLAAYADWQCAQAPPVEDVFALAKEHPGSVLLIDTYCKETSSISQHRPTLLDWLPAAWVEDLCARCRVAGVRIALAGSLGETEIRALLPAHPTWFAVRGAVCDAADRRANVQTEKVRHLAQLLRRA